MGSRGTRWAGRVGLLAALLLWVGSIAALLEGLRANEVAGLLAVQHGRAAVAAVRVEHLHGVAVMWCVVLAGLQIGAGVVGAFVLRGFYGLRTAVCFALSTCSLVLLNGLWLAGLLVWLRAYGETR